MVPKRWLMAAVLLCVAANGRAQSPLPPLPETGRGDQVDVLHGREIADPYRWLEAAESAETKGWIGAQNARTTAFLEPSPHRAAIRNRLESLWSHPRVGVPVRRGDALFYSSNDGRREQPSIMVRDGDAEPRVLLDGEALSAGASASLASWSASPDGRWLAYAVSHGGSDWWEWRVRDVATGEDLPDNLPRARFIAASWARHEPGFFYGRMPDEQTDATGRIGWPSIYYHRVGSDPADDVVAFDNEGREDRYVEAFVNDSGSHLVIEALDVPRNAIDVHLLDLTDEHATPQLMIEGDGAQYRFIGSADPVYWFRTNWDADNWRVIWIDREKLRLGEDGGFGEALPESELPLEGAVRIGGRLVAIYTKDAANEVRIHADDGALERVVELPGVGVVGGFVGEDADPRTFFGFSGLAHPEVIEELDVTTGARERFHEPAVEFDTTRFETRRVFFTSRDGTRVPMFVAHRRGLELNGENPVYLFGYGGFYASQRPGFSLVTQPWLDLGGVYALANVRGGGEYGLEWHRGGMREKKQNVFDDFIAAAEWLIETGYTRPGRLAIGGRSNGGLLVGACLTQRPELFAAAVPQVGVFDMLRFHRFTVGHAWTTEYGSPDDPAMFPHLLAYSPLHRVADGARYPATLILTGDHDDRVPPAHSYKFAAALQAAQAGPAPILLRVESDTGHGAGTPTSKVIEEWTSIWTFLAEVMDLDR